MTPKQALISLLRKTNHLRRDEFISDEVKTLEEAIEVLGILRKNVVQNHVFSGIDFEDVQNNSEEDWDKVLGWMEERE